MQNAHAREDRWCAKFLPDEFVTRSESGDAFSRIKEIVNENWWDYDSASLTHLVEVLLPVLEPLEIGGERDLDEHRQKCIDVVEEWLAGQ